MTQKHAQSVRTASTHARYKTKQQTQPSGVKICARDFFLRAAPFGYPRRVQSLISLDDGAYARAMHASITTHANAYRHRSKRVRARARLQSGLKNLKSARTLTLVPSRAPLAPPRPVRPLALGSSALPACSFPTVGFCSLTGDAPGTLTRVAGARRVAASGTRASVVSQSARSNARVRRSRIHRVARAAITPSIHPSIHPCIHPCVHACVKTTDADIKDADNRPRFSRARPRVQSSSLWVARGARRPPEDDRRATPTRDARARTHINITHAHTATHARRTSHARRTNTHTTRIASHRIASHRDRRRVPVLAFLGTATPAPTTPGDDAFDANTCASFAPCCATCVDDRCAREGVASAAPAALPPARASGRASDVVVVDAFATRGDARDGRLRVCERVKIQKKYGVSPARRRTRARVTARARHRARAPDPAHAWLRATARGCPARARTRACARRRDG